MKAPRFSSNFSSSSSGGSGSEKAIFIKSTQELQGLLATCIAASAAGDAVPTFTLQRVSQLISVIGATPLPFAKPSWSKEILLFFACVSAAREDWLSVQDFACISRLLTRASAEKQLPPNVVEAEGLYKLLIGFIKNKGCSCRDGNSPLLSAEQLAAPSTSSAISGLLHTLNTNQGLLVIHEVMRAVAQLLLASPERLQAYRFESLSALLPFCDRHAVDVETRYTAIDAVGNLLSRGAGQEAFVLLASEKGKFFSSSPSSSAVEDAAEKERQLLGLQDSCLAALIDNLRNSVALLTAVAAPTEGSSAGSAYPPSRLMVSCLRALAQAMQASRSGPRPTPTPVLQQSFQSLLQTAYTIFSVIVPPLACSDAADVLARDQAAADKGAAEHSESKLLVHAYRFLGALASLDPQLFMRSWQLFLTDSIATDNALATAVRAAVQPCVLPAFRSPLLVGASRALPAVRVAAVQCLRSLLTGLPIRKWFRATLAQSAKKSGGSRGYLGDSVASALMKITRFAVLALAVEAHEAVVQELLLLAQALVREMPLVPQGSAAGGAPALEELARALFAAVMRVAACDCAVQGRPDARLAASQGAAEWLDTLVGSRSLPLAAFTHALALTPISASAAGEALHSAAEVSAPQVNSSSWRNGNKGAVQPRAAEGARLVYPFSRALLAMAVLSTEAAPGSAHGLACRNLCASLMASYGAYMAAEGQWMRSLIDHMLLSALPQLRLLGCRLISCDLLSGPSGPAANDMAVLGCYDAEAVTTVLLRQCADSDHQCRGQAAACLGAYPRWLWAQLEGGSSREHVLGALLEASADKVGNVRAAACKALGEAALHGGLALRPAASFSGDLAAAAAASSEALGSAEAALVGEMLRQLQSGCADSKLAVRLQAVWALGCLLLVLLPLRRHRVFPSSTTDIIGNGDKGEGDVISDIVWLTSCGSCSALLADSEKLLPSAVRCLGFVTAGLSPSLPSHFATLSSAVDTLVNRILFAGKDTAVSLNDWEYYGDERYLVQRRVETLPHKLVYSICQSLGFVGWVLVTSPSDIDSGAMLERARNVLAVMLRHGAVKIRLQASKALIALISGERRRATAPGGAYSASVVTALEGVLKLVSELRPQAGAAAGSPVGVGKGSSRDGGVNAGASSSDPPRWSALQRMLLVLLWTILDPSATAGVDTAAPAALSEGLDDSAFDSITMVSQTLAFHSQELMQWLGSVATIEGKPFCLSELSLTPPQLALTEPSISLPAAASPRDIARAVCGGVARVLAQASSGSKNAGSKSWLSSVYASAEAWEGLQETLGEGPIDKMGSPAKHTSFNASTIDDDDDEI